MLLQGFQMPEDDKNRTDFSNPPANEADAVGYTRPAPRILRGFRVYEGWLSAQEQVGLVADLRDILREAPLFSPRTPSGATMSVRMTSAGQWGWMSDLQGYRYAPRHPQGSDWPPIPPVLTALWAELVPQARPPETCLLNYYGPEAKMGMHQDRDEGDLSQPVVSVSLGDEALFRIGNLERGGRTESLWLRSGDVVVMEGAARLRYHGVDRIAAGTSLLLKQPGRINLTMRVVTPHRAVQDRGLGNSA
ncbi:alpha-ketoglutarate-dependent dioxygenase AlkB [Thioclava sp. GXIMD4216]|uniref:alpha-ketoglutarate-dependent dioxygenase AlkB family protein n=1 Tax=unclassified Thioclava TaxID=2621713 RepID=UPI0030CE26DE